MERTIIIIVIILVSVVAYFLITRKQKSNPALKKDFKTLKTEVMALANAYGLDKKQKQKLLSKLRRNKQELVKMQDPMKFLLANIEL